ncbi:MAG: NUDIX hydrolase [Bacillota bacterium]
MIDYKNGNKRFCFRAAGIAFYNGGVLLHRAENDEFWTLPGGRVELMELSEDTLKREMQEELNEAVLIERLAFILENIYEFEGFTTHEIGMYFIMSFNEGSPLYDKTSITIGKEAETKLIFKWFSLEEIEALKFYPAVLKEKLDIAGTGIEHVINIEASFNKLQV